MFEGCNMKVTQYNHSQCKYTLINLQTNFLKSFSENDDTNVAEDNELQDFAKMLCDPVQGMKV